MAFLEEAETPETSLSSSSSTRRKGHGRPQGEGSRLSASREELAPGTSPDGTLILDFRPPEQRENILLLLEPAAPANSVAGASVVFCDSGPGRLTQTLHRDRRDSFDLLQIEGSGRKACCLPLSVSMYLLRCEQP